MRLAGLYLNDDDLLALADQLRREGHDDTADRLEEAYVRDVREFALTNAHREAILRATAGMSDEFAGLRDVLHAQTSLGAPENLAEA